MLRIWMAVPLTVALALATACGSPERAPDPAPGRLPKPDATLEPELEPRVAPRPRPEMLIVRGEGALPPGWSVYEFKKGKKRTAYSLDDEQGLVARADAAAAALRIQLPVDPVAYPRLRWSWRIDAPVDGDVTDKARDDCAARVLLLFRFDPKIASWGEKMRWKAAALKNGGVMPPYRILCYAWTARPYPTRIVASPHADEIAIVVTRHGAARAGAWVDETVDHLADYKTAFGADPPTIESVAVMTDTDDTGGSARARYRALRFAK